MTCCEVANHFITSFNVKDGLVYSTYFGEAQESAYIGDSPEVDSQDTEYAPPGSKYSFAVVGSAPASASITFPFAQWPANFPDPLYQVPDPNGNSFVWLAKFSVDVNNGGIVTTLDGCTGIGWEGELTDIAMSMDKDEGIAIAGSSKISQLQSTGEYCSEPTDNDFPLCDNNGLNYLEENFTPLANRCYIMHFDPYIHLDWSTQFGMAPLNYIYCVNSTGDYIFTGGYTVTNYTLWPFDTESILDYYRTSTNGGQPEDALITRFKLPQSAVSTENIADGPLANEVLIYPNPANQEAMVLLPFYAKSGERVQIFDAQGKLVYDQLLNNHVNQLSLNTGSLSSGVYWLRYIGSNHCNARCFIKE
jgi:hypothetical protein